MILISRKDAIEITIHLLLNKDVIIHSLVKKVNVNFIELIVDHECCCNKDGCLGRVKEHIYFPSIDAENNNNSFNLNRSN